jgi:hypothetical protein
VADNIIPKLAEHVRHSEDAQSRVDAADSAFESTSPRPNFEFKGKLALDYGCESGRFETLGESSNEGLPH